MKIVIVGGGAAGLAASLVLAPQNQVTVVDPGPLGSRGGGGGLFYIHQSPLFDQIIRRWGLPVRTTDVKGGVWLHGKIHSLNVVPSSFGVEWFRRMVLHHYTKTRGTSFGFHHSAMNQGGEAGQKRYDFGLKTIVAAVTPMVRKIDAIARLVDLQLSVVRVLKQDGVEVLLEFDGLVLTLPLPAIRSMLGLPAPALFSTAAYVSVASTGSCFDFHEWDYVYTPYTPGNSLYRVSATREPGVAKVEGVNSSAMALDVSSVFGSDAHLMAKPAAVSHAHVYGDVPVTPLPKNVLLLGRFAQWSPRMTMDKALERADGWRTANGF